MDACGAARAARIAKDRIDKERAKQEYELGIKAEKWANSVFKEELNKIFSKIKALASGGGTEWNFEYDNGLYHEVYNVALINKLEVALRAKKFQVSISDRPAYRLENSEGSEYLYHSCRVLTVKW